MELFLEFMGTQWHWFAILLCLLVLLMWWENRNGPQAITVHQLGSVLNQRNAKLIDLRSVKEFREGHIAQAENIPYEQWTSRASEFAKKNTPVILVCKFGQQAGGAGKEIIKAGGSIEHVYKLRGGMNDWISEQLPTITGSA